MRLKNIPLSLFLTLATLTGCTTVNVNMPTVQYFKLNKWLNFKTTREKAESENLIGSGNTYSGPIPFGIKNSEWVKFNDKIKHSDELWYWTNKYGENGYCIIRNNKIVDVFYVYSKQTK